MDDAHEEHLLRIIKGFNARVVPKYRKGQEEHGGQLWAKSNLLNEALDEVVDLYTYLATIKEQEDARLANEEAAHASIEVSEDLSPNEQ